MPSTFTWLDYSESERRKMLDVIELFGEKATRDELGLGGIRDSFADQLFPGTSTIQTRARYFLFVPWVYLELERKRVTSDRIAQRDREQEAKLIRILEASADSHLLIGRLKKENIQRLASSVYWQGLLVWGIRTFAGSQDQYHRSLDFFYARKKARKTAHPDFEGEAELDPEPTNWHSGLPQPPKGFPEGVSFRMERHEAEYLRDRILQMCPRSLLAHVLRERVVVEGIDWAWELMQAVPEHLRELLQHGQNFSEVMHGAQLLYNLMLAEKRPSVEWTSKYQERIEAWWSQFVVRQYELQAWDRARFWSIVDRGNPRVSARAKAFVNRWSELATRASDLEQLLEGDAARRLVEHRELQLKKGLARLRGGRPLELWEGSAGADQLDLRWSASRRILNDILNGLEAPADA